MEAEYEALGGNNNEVGADNDAGEDASSSILHSLRKRICREREQHAEVRIKAVFQKFRFIKFRFDIQKISFFPQDSCANVSSTIEAYLKLPLEEFKCLRFTF